MVHMWWTRSDLYGTRRLVYTTTSQIDQDISAIVIRYQSQTRETRASFPHIQFGPPLAFQFPWLERVASAIEVG